LNKSKRDEMKKPLIAVTLGDPAGIGPEIIIKALGRLEILKSCRLLVIGDRQVLAEAAQGLGKPLFLKSISGPEEAEEENIPACLYEASAMSKGQVLPGRPDPQAAPMVLNYIRLAADWALKGRVQAMVTGPVSKEVIRRHLPSFTGHTEFLARLARCRTFGMMLAGERLKVSLATIHLSLKKALRTLDSRKILQTIRLTHKTMTDCFGLNNPRLAVAGLNPHAGEQGAFGTEERTLVLPAVEEAQAQGISASGPFPPDTLFYWAAQGRYEAVVALYHDQGLIPLKLLHFDSAVNITMGLPFIRTSVDHGTAFDLAGRGLANPESLVQAVILAADFARRRALE
jgi:4-hydroxythreonine-4-phosphate dehydrogenase